MKNHFNKIYLFVLVLFFGLNGYAQLFPVQLTPVFKSPYSVKISDYATSMDTKFQLLINPTDVTISQRQVRLKLYIQGNGVNIKSSDYITGQRPIFVNGGEFQTLTNTDISALFRLENLQGITPAQYANPLPDGMYDFCFEMYDYITNQKISQKSCANIYLILNDPPLLNTPQKNEQIAASDFPNIMFTWTPRQMNATNVSYKFELKQLIDPTLDPQFAFQMSPLLYEETVFSTAMLYNLSMPILTPGMRYAWRVRAISTTGLSENAVFKNDGYSEIYSFKYTQKCDPPIFALSEIVSPSSVKISWQGLPYHTKYQVQYRKQAVVEANKRGKEKQKTVEWFSTYTNNDQALLTNLEQETAYEFKVGSTCTLEGDGVQSFSYTNANTFTIPKKDNTIAGYNCGIKPNLNITNKTPIVNLLESETFMAGDFPVRITELSGKDGIYTGKGVVEVPYLENLKLSVKFNDILINTNYQLINGVVETAYDPSWKNVIGIDPLIEEIFGPQSGSDDNADAATDNSTHIDNDSENIDESSVINTEKDESKNTDTNPIVSVEPSNEENPEKEPNTTDESTGTNNNSETENKDNSNQTSKKGYFIEYKNKKYYTGDKIPIPFNRNLLAYNSFKMGELEKDTNVKYELGYQSEQGVRFESLGGNNYLKKTESKAEANFDFSFDNTLKYSLKSTADIDKKPSLSNEINLVVKPFKLTSLKAIDNSNSKRFAVSNETLYYVNKPTVSTESKNTKFEVSYAPNLSVDEIPSKNIKWNFNDTYDEKKDGIKSFSVKVNENKNVNVVVIGGVPELENKNVNVKWVDENRGDASFMPPAVSHTVQEFSRKILIPLKKVTDKLNDFLGTDKFKGEIKPVKIKGEKYNEEDKTSRHYFEITKGTINGGLAIKGEFLGYPPFLKILNIDGVSKVGIYVTPKVEFNLSGGAIRKKILETNKIIEDELFVEGSLKGCVELGLKAELLVAKDLVDFSVSGFGEGCASGKVNYNISTNDFKGGLYLDPIKLGVKAKIKSKGSFNFTLVDIDKSWSITDKIPLYEFK